MRGVLVDSNVILDIFQDDATWFEWSASALEKYGAANTLYINAIVYTEVSIGFKRIEQLEIALSNAGFEFLQIPKEALFLAGKAFVRYRKRAGVKTSPLPDFYIGAHAAVERLSLMTRDTARYRTYYPTIELIAPSARKAR
ncbi:MAG: type II toxin-antitoxin system VapC family toxin [Gammaproteobacteria bacterium]